MNKKQFLQLVDEKEGVNLEFKQGFSASIAKEMVAFANTVGGFILLGVTDAGKLQGLSNINRVLSQIQNIADSCSPSVPFKVRPLKINKTEVVMIEIPNGLDKPYSCAEGFFVRNGATSQKLKRNQIIEFLNKEGHIGFESKTDESFSFVKDFDTDAR